MLKICAKSFVITTVLMEDPLQNISGYRATLYNRTKYVKYEI